MTNAQTDRALAAARRVDRHMTRVCLGAIVVATCWIGMPALAAVLQGVIPA